MILKPHHTYLKPEYYNTSEAFEFITILMNSMYITVINAIIFTINFFLLWTQREAPAALLILPITVNVVGFHAFLDGGLFTGGAVMGNIMLLINLYLIWKNCSQYKNILQKNS